VLVTGMAEIVSDGHSSDVTDRSRSLGIEPFEEQATEHLVRIIIHGVSGRYITPADFDAPLDGRGYL